LESQTLEAHTFGSVHAHHASLHELATGLAVKSPCLHLRHVVSVSQSNKQYLMVLVRCKNNERERRQRKKKGAHHQPFVEQGVDPPWKVQESCQISCPHSGAENSPQRFPNYAAHCSCRCVASQHLHGQHVWVASWDPAKTTSMTTGIQCNLDTLLFPSLTRHLEIDEQAPTELPTKTILLIHNMRYSRSRSHYS
jgi:hypothetical protein